ncbi:MAG TPA: hypothetical protein VFH61_01990 [Thermoleophilia bacterium]|nr:hypothetical protein [Thermoleophilia bacterium]
MSDTQYKRTPATPDFLPASSLALSDPSELVRPPAQAAARSVDSTLGGRRMVLSRHTGGAHQFLVDSTATGGASQGKPDAVTWRRVAFDRFEQQAGTALVVRIVYVPSGASEYQDLASWELSGVGGQVRVTVSWSLGGSSESTSVERTLDGEVDPDGAEQLGDGAQWGQLQHQVATIIRPGDAANDFAVAAAFSEWATTELAVEDRGGARVVHVSVAEVPVEHVTDDKALEPSLSGSSPQWETNRPQTEAPDGANFEEHRYGAFRALQVTARQTQRVGPIVAQWSAYSETAAGVTDTDVAPRSRTLATFARLSAGLNTAWDPSEVGWFVQGTARAPEHLASRIVGAGSIPVLIRVEARFTGAGAAVGVVRFASSHRSWVDVLADQAVIGTTWTVLEQRGWLEASIASDDYWPVLQDFFRSDGANTLEVRGFSVSYGDFTVS